MIGPILLALSWMLLRLEGKSLAAIGIDAPRLRVRQFTAGFLVAGAVAAMQQMGYSIVAGVSWKWNPEASRDTFVECLRFTTNSVLYEELVFRGYFLYQAVRFVGCTYGVLIDAVAFGIYHWFSYELFGNVPAMVFVFVFTGAFGGMCALAFAKTKSVVSPIGLHLGWNLVSYFIFSAGPSGRVLLIPSNGEARLQAGGWAGLLIGVALPLALVLGVIIYFLRYPVARPAGPYATKA